MQIPHRHARKRMIVVYPGTSSLLLFVFLLVVFICLFLLAWLDDFGKGCQFGDRTCS